MHCTVLFFKIDINALAQIFKNLHTSSIPKNTRQEGCDVLCQRLEQNSAWRDWVASSVPMTLIGQRVLSPGALLQFHKQFERPQQMLSKSRLIHSKGQQTGSWSPAVLPEAHPTLHELRTGEKKSHNAVAASQGSNNLEKPRLNLTACLEKSLNSYDALKCPWIQTAIIRKVMNFEVIS